MKPIIALLLTSLLAGCATGAMDSVLQVDGQGSVRQEQSTFDNSTTIRMKPANLFNGANAGAAPVQLGAVWSSKTPTAIGLLLATDGFTGITGMDVNIDGEITALDSRSATQFGTTAGYGNSGFRYPESTQLIVVPMEFAQRMVAGKDVRLRVRTDAGRDESIFSVERNSAGSPAAKPWFKKFLTQVYDFQRAR